MIKRIVVQRGPRKVVLMDSISHVDADDAGHIVVAASHGGASSAEFAGRHQVAAVFVNDAGVGKDAAGIAALGLLQVPAAAVSHHSARIGDAEDMWRNGVIAHVNPAAAKHGVKAGDRLADAVEKLL